MSCSLEHESLLHAQGFHPVAGIDEAGRGPLAGPVLAAAVILPAGFSHPVLRDSKQLTARQRDQIYAELTTRTDILWAIAAAEPEEIDRINILRATHEAMRRAFLALSHAPTHALIDGLPVPDFPAPHTALVRGDQKSFSIAAASILAKVARDRLMQEMDGIHPGYEFSRHKGYGTALHLERLRVNGPSPIHRRSFLPVQQAVFHFGNENPRQG
jgi:ribonuclease HII